MPRAASRSVATPRCKPGPAESTAPGSVPDDMDVRDTEKPGGGRFDEAGDATRRTRLANERTYLAWWRTGLTAFAVSLGGGKLVPALTDETRWPYVLVGVGFALLGVAFVGYGFRRQWLVERAVSRGEYARPHEGLLAWLTGIGMVLGLVLLVIVVVEG
jgi:putative membrane protein